MQGKPRRQDGKESRPEGGQAPDQASSGRQTGAPPHTRRQIIPKARTKRPVTRRVTRGTATTRLATAPDRPTPRVLPSLDGNSSTEDYNLVRRPTLSEAAPGVAFSRKISDATRALPLSQRPVSAARRGGGRMMSESTAPLVKANWRLTKPQQRGFAFWFPVGLVFGAVELAGALSGRFATSSRGRRSRRRLVTSKTVRVGSV
jgi:hypothetical protein